MFLMNLCLGVVLAATSGLPGTQHAPITPLPGPTAPSATQPAAPKKIKESPQKTLHELIKQKQEPQTTNSPLYIYPGLVRLKDNNWVGYDYLYNLTSNIPVEVTIVKPQDASVPVNEEEVRNRIAAILQGAGISTEAQIIGGQPPQALFNMMILIYPLNDGYIALCDGRLIETVQSKRVELAPAEGSLQAITWEHKNLIVATSNNFSQLLHQTVDQITKTFVERYEFFKNLKKQ